MLFNAPYSEPYKPPSKPATVPAGFNFNHREEVRKMLEVCFIYSAITNMFFGVADVRILHIVTTVCEKRLALPQALNAGDASPLGRFRQKVSRAAGPVL